MLYNFYKNARQLTKISFFAASVLLIQPITAHAQLNCPATPGGRDGTPMIAPNWVCGLSEMTKQMVTGGYANVASVGGFFDAQNHVQSQTALNVMKAEAANSYSPDTQICRFGTLGKSLANSEAMADLTLRTLNHHALKRDLVMSHSSSSAEQLTSRKNEYRSVYCDINQNAMKYCDPDGTRMTLTHRTDRDIDYVKLIDTKQTLDIDFSNITGTQDEEDLLAMMYHLYTTKTFPIPDDGILAPSGSQKLDDPANFAIGNLRSVQATYAVARNSFHNIIADKTKGSAGSDLYIKNAMAALVTNPTELNIHMGTAPSYSAQMELLTKKIYQDPRFYTGLIESPENVKRQKAAMGSIKLMQDRDFFESMLRREMLLSQLVELKISERMVDVNSALKNLNPIE